MLMIPLTGCGATGNETHTAEAVTQEGPDGLETPGVAPADPILADGSVETQETTLDACEAVLWGNTDLSLYDAGVLSEHAGLKVFEREGKVATG